MTIKEIEQHTEMTRANIRFYESEGLITPARNANGYRDYSVEDADTLMKIKLLRNLQISLEDIKKLQDGSLQLKLILANCLLDLDRKTEKLMRSKDVCRTMQTDEVSYNSMNANKYLELLLENNDNQNLQIEQDIIPREKISARRFFARMLDWYLLRIIIYTLLILALHIRPANVGLIGQILIGLFIVMLTLFIEPVLLSKFGTTLGKGILGIQVEDIDGGKLSLTKATNRTASVLGSGMGLGIPIYMYVRIYNSWHTLLEGKELSWESESVETVKDKKLIRVLIYLIVVMILTGIFFFSLLHLYKQIELL
ncbi:MAG: MerR family transcriptional regulator [Tyzzerella sp.]|nr:MerR family transcriptional regulator [Tyzzerella sp.]